MMHNGKVSESPERNDFIKVGRAQGVAISALHQVYGEGLCPAALCSTKPKARRAQCCDMKSSPGHKELNKRAHDLPEKSGPNHKRTWSKVLSLTEKIRKDKRQKRK
jgi:hypothetical protein